MSLGRALGQQTPRPGTLPLNQMEAFRRLPYRQGHSPAKGRSRPLEKGHQQNAVMHDQQVNILDLVKSLRDDTTALVRDEIALAKTEISEKVAATSRNVGFLAAGALVAYAALILLLLALAWIVRAFLLSGEAVSEPTATVLGLLIIGIVVGGLGASLIVKALNALKKETPVPTKTVQSLEDDKNWVQGKVS
jgi:RsiW-degrading membrane proteinase PrsW (M82 family)